MGRRCGRRSGCLQGLSSIESYSLSVLDIWVDKLFPQGHPSIPTPTPIFCSSPTICYHTPSQGEETLSPTIFITPQAKAKRPCHQLFVITPQAKAKRPCYQLFSITPQTKAKRPCHQLFFITPQAKAKRPCHKPFFVITPQTKARETLSPTICYPTPSQPFVITPHHQTLIKYSSINKIQVMTNNGDQISRALISLCPVINLNRRQEGRST